jgi:hypothetical protein
LGRLRVTRVKRAADAPNDVSIGMESNIAVTDRALIDLLRLYGGFAAALELAEKIVLAAVPASARSGRFALRVLDFVAQVRSRDQGDTTPVVVTVYGAKSRELANASQPRVAGPRRRDRLPPRDSDLSQAA